MTKNANRRTWLSAIVPSAADAVVSRVEARLGQALPPQRRPPGAVAEAQLLELCTRCDDCADACPHGAILKFTEKAGPLLEATPVLRPETVACHMCEGFPCAQACRTGALVQPFALTWPLGTVRVRRDRCFTFLGPECGACVGVCPDGAEGISLAGTHPVVDPELCVGCGKCIHVCPTMPKAIEMVPL